MSALDRTYGFDLSSKIVMWNNMDVVVEVSISFSNSLLTKSSYLVPYYESWLENNVLP
jgi:hypothetical protein